MHKLTWLAAVAALVLASPAVRAGTCPAASVWDVKHAAAVAGHIANGHAWTKHASEYQHSTITDGAKFKTLVENTIKTAGAAMSNNRHKWWNATNKTIVIFNPKDDDCGTAFVPSAGKTYYDNQN